MTFPIFSGRLPVQANTFADAGNLFVVESRERCPHSVIQLKKKLQKFKGA